ncbi:helix-turn-helix transcriptional regulator [Actinoplanes sp. NPDC049596]|uniref:helix-turn-helix domain-containing protein n=1 Tax=unclassified Actinoplanes TaxID=2626549 RepID=UPI003429C1A9
MELPRRQAPTVRLRRLAAELRALRHEAGLTPKAVQERTEINPATLYRVETAKVRPQRRTLISLLEAYGVAKPRQEELLELLKQSAEQGWVAAFENELPELYLHYVNFEADARSLRNYETIFVPGLLQTRDYAHAAITQAGLPIASAEDITRRVDVRIQRQSLLEKDSPLQLWAILDESALRRMVGGPAVMRAQLEHLLQAGESPNIVIQVIPFDAGAHAGMPGSFVILDFPDPQDPDLVYSDSMAGDLFLESEADIRRFSAIFDLLRAAALSPQESARMITQRAHTLKKGPTS